MNLTIAHFANQRPAVSRGVRAFTMVEVAIALGVIAIALVAIIGVLPTGLQVQQENREDTLFNQDGQLFLQLIREGQGVLDPTRPLQSRLPDWPNSLDYLTNHVLAVGITNAIDGATIYVNPFLVRRGQQLPFGGLQSGARILPYLTNGLHIVGLLSRPKLEARPGGNVTNYVAALVRSLSGPATDQGTVGRELALTYVLTSELMPLGNYPANWLDYTVPGLTAAEVIVRSNRLAMAVNQGFNFNEVRLALHGPAFEATRDGERRWVTYGKPTLLRTVVAGRLFHYQVQGDPQFSVSFVLQDGYRRVTP